MRTKIVCTIGPSSRSPEMLRALISAGMDVARLNFSFGTHEYHAENVARIRAASSELGKPVGVLMDLQGPKLRVGTVAEEGVLLSEGQEVTLTAWPERSSPQAIPLQYKDLPRLVEPGHRILIDDGLIELRVLSTTEDEIRCRVVTGGLLLSNKGLNLPRASSVISAITDKDREDLGFALQQQADWIALSFVRTAAEVYELKEMIQQECEFGRPTPVVAKIEKPEAVEHIDEIIAAADAVMVARGDLGIEASPEEVPLVQKMIIAKCNLAGKPVITATQMLDSMIRNPRPTRAEASDVANAILDGSDAIMLSGETAVGKYPLQALQTMVRIAERTELGMGDGALRREPAPGRRYSIAEAVAHASCETARDLAAAAIITPTVSGQTPKLVAMFRPSAPIVAVTPSPMVQRQLTLVWGVVPLLARRSPSTDEMIAEAVQVATAQGMVKPGDVVVVTAGAPSGGVTATPTDLMKVIRLERVLASGLGVGEQVVQGRVRILSSASQAAVASDEIIVLRQTDRSFVPLLRKARGLIAELGDVRSHAAMLAVELGIPAVVGVSRATELFHDGQEITLDPSAGRIYDGFVRPR